MASPQVARHVLVTRRIEEVSGIRPVTLLIASGIVLITAVLIVTGIAASNLREQALATAERDLVRVDSVLAEAATRSLLAVDSRLAEVANRLRDMPGGDGFREAAATPEIAALLHSQLERFPRVDALALIAADGALVSRAGAWPAGEAARSALLAFEGQPAPGSSVGAAIRDPRT